VVADVATTGGDALWMVRAAEYDAVVLDVMLPDVDGFETCRRLRTEGVWVPIIMLTARDAVGDRVHGLDTGADDYLSFYAVEVSRTDGSQVDVHLDRNFNVLDASPDGAGDGHDPKR
jgi:PleD family two-component response regulator